MARTPAQEKHDRRVRDAQVVAAVKIKAILTSLKPPSKLTGKQIHAIVVRLERIRDRVKRIEAASAVTYMRRLG